MGYRNLSQCLEELESRGELVRISEEVDPNLEIGAIQRRVFRAQGPALLFTKVNVLSFKGWKIGKMASRQLMRQRRPIAARDLVPDLEQKQVDMKIGLDIAWLSSKNIADRIILVTGDADFIPVMKFARREGVQIILVTLGHCVRAEMREHTDIFREVNWPPPQPPKLRLWYP